MLRSPDAGRELSAAEVEQGEVGQRGPVRVGGVLGDREVGGVAEALVEHQRRLGRVGSEDLGIERGMLIGV